MRISAVLSASLLIGTSVAQQTTPDSNIVIRSSTREVLLEVVVRDAHGRLITKVEPGQVAVYENGVKQEIRSFRLVHGSEVRAQDEKQATQTTSYETVPGSSTNHRPPLSPLRTVNVVCLVLNDLTPDTRAYAFDAAKKFVNKELRADTFIGVFTLDSGGIKPVFPFSNNRAHLLKAVELAASKQLAPLNQSTAAIVNALSLSTMAQPMGFANLANQSNLNGLPYNPDGSPVVIGASNYGVSDGASTQDPLGVRGDMDVAVQAGLREIEALTKLVRQLTPLPFQKTVLLMGTGLTRPPDQMEYWKSLIRSANTGGVTFYALDVYGLAVCQDSPTSIPGTNNDCATGTTAAAASVALLEKSVALSQLQTSVAVNAGQTTPRSGGGVNYVPSDSPQLMESMHQSDYARFAVLSANTQEALRDLAESTGGFLIANTNNSEKLLTRVMEDVDTHFEISYRPATDREDGHYRNIEVKLAWSDGRVQTRHGYFAVPETEDNPLTPADLAGLQALDTKPLPQAFDFQSKAFRFRSEEGTSQYSIAFEVPISNLTATPDAAQKKQRFHASLLALVKNDKGEVVERISRDVPSEVPDTNLAALRSDYMTYEHAVSLPPGHYTIETAVVDQEGNRASTKILQLDNRDQPGLGVSDIALVHIVQNMKRQPDPADPFEIPGKRASPFVSTALPAGADPFVYFVIYPAQNSGAVPSLGAQFLKNGQILATQKSALPAPDESGAIPMTIRAVREPGDYEVRVTVEQGRASVERSLKYTIAAK